jgi:hypothetical protein
MAPPRLAAKLTGGNLDGRGGWLVADGVADTRAWLIPNVTSGIVGIDGHFRCGSRPSRHSGDARELTGNFNVTGMTVHYLRPLPPIEGGAASAVITAENFSADIQAGHVGAIAIAGGKLLITGLDVEDQFISIGGDLVSPVGTLSSFWTIASSATLQGSAFIPRWGRARQRRTCSSISRPRRT